MREEKEKGILDIIAENAVNERLDAVMFSDPVFQQLEKRIGEDMAAFDRMALSKKERRAVDRLLSANAASAAYYSTAAYRQGVRDCVSLFRETGVIK